MEESATKEEAVVPNAQTVTTTPAPNASAAAPAAHEFTMVMSILAYIGPLVFVPLVAAKEDATAQFHVKQGLVLFIGEAVVFVASSMLGYIAYMLAPVFAIVNLAFIVFSIIGIVHVVKGEQKELPFIGHLAAHLKF
jgi:uncharacterized membrane protein